MEKSLRYFILSCALACLAFSVFFASAFDAWPLSAFFLALGAASFGIALALTGRAPARPIPPSLEPKA